MDRRRRHRRCTFGLALRRARPCRAVRFDDIASRSSMFDDDGILSLGREQYNDLRVWCALYTSFVPRDVARRDAAGRLFGDLRYVSYGRYRVTAMIDCDPVAFVAFSRSRSWSFTKSAHREK